MKERSITINLKKAKEWYNSENHELKEIALQAFSEDELKYNFKNITSFRDACLALDICYDTYNFEAKQLAKFSKASAAMFQLNIIRKALNLGQDLHLTENPKDSYTYYPYLPFTTLKSTLYKKAIDSGKMEIIGMIESEGKIYDVLSGYAYTSGWSGVGHFNSYNGAGNSDSDLGFLGCATEKIAQHFGKCFGMLIFEAKYSDIVDFKIILIY